MDGRRDRQTGQDDLGRRDEYGRVSRFPELVGLLAAGLVLGVLAMVLLDGAFALFGAGEFGRVNGWLALILPTWVFVEEFRAWRAADVPLASVTVAALGAATVGVTGGLLASAALAALADLPPLASGAVGASCCAVGYAGVWFPGVRWLAGHGLSGTG